MVFNLVSFVSSTPFHIGFTTRLFINTPPETTKPDKPSMGPDHFGWTTNKMLAAAGATNCGGEQMVIAWISKKVILMIRVRKRIVLWWFQEVALNSIMGVLWEKRTSRYFQAISPKKNESQANIQLLRNEIPQRKVTGICKIVWVSQYATWGTSNWYICQFWDVIYTFCWRFALTHIPLTSKYGRKASHPSNKISCK